MSNVIKRLASEVSVQPAYIKGMEQKGLCFFTWADSNTVGGQCAQCHTVIWTSARENSILNEEKPDYVPDSGKGYRKYYDENLERFLHSLPACPVCTSRNYNKFINNVSYPRFLDGTFFDDEDPSLETVSQNSESIDIWWYEEEKQ